jgi:glycogen(starch) synthase
MPGGPGIQSTPFLVQDERSSLKARVPTMRILFLAIGYAPTALHGSAVYTRHMARALASRGHEVHVLDCDPWGKERDEEEDGVAFHRRRLRRVRGLRYIQRALPAPAWSVLESWRHERLLGWFDSESVKRRIINAYHYYDAYRRLGTYFDVVESPGLSLDLFFGLLRPTALVVHLHTPVGFELLLEREHLGPRVSFANWLDRTSALRANVLTSGSRMMVQALRKSGWLSSNEPLIVPLTIDPSRWSSLPSAHDTAPVVLTVGRLEFRKAPEVLVEGAARLREEIEGLEVIFVGSAGRPSEYRDRLVDLAQRVRAPCRFEGQITDAELLSRYASARVVAIPSRSESFSLVGLEAMAAGRPIVCTSAVGLAEFVEGTGAGTVVPPDDPAALAEGLRPYLESPALAAKAGERAREVVRTNFAPPKIASEREAAYEEAIRRWRGRRKVDSSTSSGPH